MLLLEHNRMWTSSPVDLTDPAGERRHVRSTNTTPYIGRGWNAREHGFLVAWFDGHETRNVAELDEQAMFLTGVTVPHLLTEDAVNDFEASLRTHTDTAALGIVSNRFLVGPWFTVSDEYRHEVAREEEVQQARDRAHAATQARFRELAGRLDTLGVHTALRPSLDDARVGMPLDALEELLRLAERP